MSYGADVRDELQLALSRADGSDSAGVIVHSLKVLILEDHPFQLMALHQMLNANQVFDVLAADSVEVARLSLQSRGPVDIAICDLQMEGPDGLELIRFMAENGLARALIIVSCSAACVLEGVAQLALAQGLNVLGYMQKPASAGALYELLEAYGPGRSDCIEQAASGSTFSALCAIELFDPTGSGPIDVASIAEQWITYFQPKVSLQGELLGAEALVRWQHPVYGLLAPGRFIEAIEAEGLTVALTWRVLDQALQFSAQAMREQGEALSVAVNIDPHVLQQLDFAEQITQALARHGVPATALTLEILEQDAARPETWQLEGLLRLCMQGCKLSIDDFGMGASNIDRLLQLPFSELKIPTEFVRGMADDARKSAVVAGALLMAQRLSMSVVVEGVETSEDVHSLLALGDPAIQGYFIARPMSASAFMRWVAERDSGHLHAVCRDDPLQDIPLSCK
ncbi:EAL domain-containing response regulator [Pseudomonas syringae pv. aptata]|uniref:EAL domain, c-di-GMP-specific phosphodiesterase class I (Or its enzymatically inactive variant) n=1 Tax=Pseudomonas syringae TaxID=317 RepID=A0AB38BSG6_PSESX|nr:EAL domain-containing response regulator [Pseudomonas syringae]MCK0546628.1 EAL domain-containing response regulator [Pseudomonas syringae pv. aptata]SFO01043.1 EAL domain, c-di-GMP-specific phosphodiesterase class I (or its enzymatically inactive variant) [Pseudomonas syringae]SFO49703.1 EAL domain, c-di-GMP-specific phosphodiesterase class I (or its enzymatically inactive variant) [Pseudomonas syringae]